jgi:hypothetical protein
MNIKVPSATPTYAKASFSFHVNLFVAVFLFHNIIINRSIFNHAPDGQIVLEKCSC